MKHFQALPGTAGADRRRTQDLHQRDTLARRLARIAECRLCGFGLSD